MLEGPVFFNILLVLWYKSTKSIFVNVVGNKKITLKLIAPDPHIQHLLGKKLLKCTFSQQNNCGEAHLSRIGILQYMHN